MLQFKLLGGPQVIRDGDELKGFVSRKTQALLFYLVVTRRAQFRETLQGLLWGDASQTHAAGNLRVALNNLRQVVPGFLDITRSQVAISQESDFWLDVADFEVSAARPEIEQLQRAVDLFCGDLLDGFCVSDSQPFEEWLLAERERLRMMMLQSLHGLVSYYTTRGEYSAGIKHATRLLAVDPWREETHRDLMRLLALSGQRSAALAQYEQCRRLLAAELGLEPLEETRALYEALVNREFNGLPGPVGNDPENLTQAFVIPFVGRSEEHACLVKYWQAAQRGNGCLTLIEGEAGIGKSRLADEITRYLRTQGATVLHGHCYEFGNDVPYFPIVQALRGYLAHLSSCVGKPTGRAPLARELSPVWLAELSRLLPEVTDIWPGLPDPPSHSADTSRQRLFEAVARFLGAIIHPSTSLCLFLDDLHWASQTTLDLLHYLVRQLSGQSVWILGTYRPEEIELSHPLMRLRQGLRRDSQLTLLTLKPLSADAVSELACALGMEKDECTLLGNHLYRESEGNPFILTETLNSLQEQGTLQPQKGGWCLCGSLPGDLLPASVKDVILQRVGRLSIAAQRLLALAAVIGQPFDLPLLQAVSDSEANVDNCLGEWLERRLVQPSMISDRFKGEELTTDHHSHKTGYDFSHDKIRAAVYYHTSPAQRRFLHHRVGSALEALSNTAPADFIERLAYHFEQAGDVEKALEYLPQAAEHAAAIYAAQDALNYYARGQALLAENDERQWLLMLGQAKVLRFLNDYEQAIAICQKTLYNAQSIWQLRAVNLLGDIYREHRDYDQARQTLEQGSRLTAALAAQSSQDLTREQAQAKQSLGVLEREQGNLSAAQALLSEALALYRQADEPSPIAECLRSLGDVCADRGDYAQARVNYHEALSLFQEIGNRQGEAVCRRIIGVAFWREANHDAAHQSFTESLQICRAIGDRQGEAASLNGLGMTAIVRNDIDGTERYWQESAAIYRQLGLDKRTASALHNLAILYMDHGKINQAQQCLEDALTINRAADARVDQALDMGWLGKLHWLLGDYAAAADYLDKTLALDRETGGSKEQDYHLLWRAMVACETGDWNKAAECLQEAQQWIETSGPDPSKVFDVHFWMGELALAQGDAAAALRHVQWIMADEGQPRARKMAGIVNDLLGRIHAAGLSDSPHDPKPYFERAQSLLQNESPGYNYGVFLRHYGIFLARNGDLASGISCLQEAQTLFETLGFRGELGKIEKALAEIDPYGLMATITRL